MIDKIDDATSLNLEITFSQIKQFMILHPLMKITLHIIQSLKRNSAGLDCSVARR